MAGIATLFSHPLNEDSLLTLDPSFVIFCFFLHRNFNYGISTYGFFYISSVTITNNILVQLKTIRIQKTGKHLFEETLRTLPVLAISRNIAKLLTHFALKLRRVDDTLTQL